MSPRLSVRMSTLLRPTRFLDFDVPAVADFARDAAGGAVGPRAQAVRVFRAVRDQVRYDPYTASIEAAELTASATLARGRAFCVPKAVLLGACLRALGIPTRLGFADVTNHLATARLLALLRTDVFAFHGYVDAWLEGRWVKATPAFHAELCAWFGVPPLDWDGVHDAILQPHDGKGRPFMQYLTDRGVHDDLPYDELVRVWHELYPHLYESSGSAVLGGDFAAEAAAKRRAGPP